MRLSFLSRRTRPVKPICTGRLDGYGNASANDSNLQLGVVCFASPGQFAQSVSIHLAVQMVSLIAGPILGSPGARSGLSAGSLDALPQIIKLELGLSAAVGSGFTARCSMLFNCRWLSVLGERLAYGCFGPSMGSLGSVSWISLPEQNICGHNI